jgi:hypothetical protein
VGSLWGIVVEHIGRIVYERIGQKYDSEMTSLFYLEFNKIKKIKIKKNV